MGAFLVLLLLAFGTFAFTATSGNDVLNSLWLWFATLSTIGFGDETPDWEAFASDVSNHLSFQTTEIIVVVWVFLILLGVVALAYLISSAIEFVSLVSAASEEETANDDLKRWRGELGILHGRKNISSDNQSIDLVFQMIDHEDNSPSSTINRKEVTVCVFPFMRNVTPNTPLHKSECIKTQQRHEQTIVSKSCTVTY